MPRYFFHVRKDGRAPDTVGVHLDDLDSARAEAARCLAEEMRSHPHELWDDGEWYVNVADEHGLILLTVYSAAFVSASVEGKRP